ncbi:GNAT family N-acetyltransferase [Brevundimonas terrae]|uniref:GNAT family N-acetyltransferase n=1 Tax=Brevundimonas terrae TaxID=363631 RepID=A0ABN0Y2U2_9CAUL|nr:GNAT family N-acetyltransferase [Brevundimonas terrae]NIJ25949.1 ribosomal-protein-alanine N-acetyltransferase [Brevundimonas terrae]
MHYAPLTPEQLATIHAEAFEAPWDAAAFAQLLDSTGVSLLGDERSFILTRTIADEAEILTIAVRPSNRRQGLARHLVEQAVVATRVLGAERMFLEVAENNLAAIGLYAACGFEQVGLRKNYYTRADGSSEHARVMVLNFLL